MLDLDMVIVHISLAGLERVGIDVAQDFKAVFRFAADGSERHCDGQSDHAGAGDPDAHGVLDDVAAEKQGNAVGQRAEQFRSLGHAQRYGRRLRASARGHHFALYQLDDLVSDRFVHRIED